MGFTGYRSKKLGDIVAEIARGAPKKAKPEDESTDEDEDDDTGEMVRKCLERFTGPSRPWVFPVKPEGPKWPTEEEKEKRKKEEEDMKNSEKEMNEEQKKKNHESRKKKWEQE